MGTRQGRVIVRGNSLMLQFYCDGIRYRPTIPGLSANIKAHRQTAESILIRIQADIATGNFNLYKYFPNHPQALRHRTASDITISELLSKWLDRKYRECEASTFRDYRSAIKTHLDPSFGSLSLSELTTIDVREWIQDQYISNKRINNVLIPLRAIFSEAYQDELIDQNPLDRIKHLPRTSPEVTPFTKEEMIQILSECEGQIRNIFQFAFWSGVRTSELVALRWSDVDFDKGTAFIRNVRTRAGEKDRPKTNSGIRKLELLKPALDALIDQQNYTNDSDHVFHNPRTDEPWTHDGPLRKTAWKPALARAGVTYRKAYCTRHTFASLVLSAGADPMWVAYQMGHKDWGMIRKVYGRWLPDVNSANQNKIEHLWTQPSH